jgi:hypothetical protein
MWYIKIARHGVVMKHESVEFLTEAQAMRYIMTLLSTREEFRQDCTFFVGFNGRPGRQVFQN